MTDQLSFDEIPHPEVLWAMPASDVEWQIDCENPECGLSVSSNVRDSFEEAAGVYRTIEIS